MDRRGLPGELQRAQCEPDRMAGKGRWHAAARGRGNRPGIARNGAQCRAHVELDSRPEMSRASRGALARLITLVALAIALIAGSASSSAGEQIVSSRVWPAQEYTRVTLESAPAGKHQFFFANKSRRLRGGPQSVE